MIVFWVIAALLLAGALLWLVPPLLGRRAAATQPEAGVANVAVYRDQLREAEQDLAADLITPERFAQARAEIERRVLEDTAAAASGTVAPGRASRRTASVLALLVPLASVGTYLAIGEPRALDAAVAAATAGDGEHAVSRGQIAGMVATLAERMQAQPGDVQGWLMLGRSYSALGRYAEAVAALRQAVGHHPRDVDLLADLADMLGMQQGRKLAGEPQRLVLQALALDPRHVKSLALAGSAAFEAQDYAAARAFWGRLLAAAPADSELADSARGGIAEAERRLGGPARAAAGAPGAAASVAAGRERITGQVRLDPQLATRVSAGDTLFVYARAAEGPRLPLAIVKRAAGELPLRFELDDTSAMTPEHRLSGQAQVVVEARISKSGQATPRSGDLVGQAGPLAPGTQDLKITIDRLQP